MRVKGHCDVTFCFECCLLVLFLFCFFGEIFHEGRLLLVIVLILRARASGWGGACGVTLGLLPSTKRIWSLSIWDDVWASLVVTQADMVC